MTLHVSFMTPQKYFKMFHVFLVKKLASFYTAKITILCRERRRTPCVLKRPFNFITVLERPKTL
jgi:hypothetical protein